MRKVQRNGSQDGIRSSVRKRATANERLVADVEAAWLEAEDVGYVLIAQHFPREQRFDRDERVEAYDPDGFCLVYSRVYGVFDAKQAIARHFRRNAAQAAEVAAFCLNGGRER